MSRTALARLTLTWTLRAVALLLVLWLAASFAAERISLHSPRAAPRLTPAHWGMRYTDVSFRTADGLELRGWWIPGTEHHTVVMVHGLGGNRDEPLARAGYLHQAGYNLLVFDLRGHGESDGTGTTMGYREPLDVSAAVGEARLLDPGPIALFGYSLGGAAVVEEAAGDPRVSAVIDDSGFSSAAEVMLARFTQVTRLPSIPFAAALLAFGTVDFGTSPWDVQPAAMAATLRRPMLVIVGGADTIVPPAEGLAVYDAAAGPKQLLEIPAAGHTQAFSAATGLYEATVLGFLSTSLAS